MHQSYRRPLIAGALLLVLALALSACAANGAAAPSASTPGVSPGSTAASATAGATSTVSSGVGSSPVATATLALDATAAQPAATSAGPASGATTTTSGSNSTPSASGTTSPDASGAGANAATIGSDGLSNATYTAVEYSYSGPDQLPAGWTRLTLDNQGKEKHDIMLYKVAAGKTLEDVTQALAANGPPDWAQSMGSTTAAAGAKSSYIVNLTPGNYVMLSFGDNPQGGPDAAKGMLKMITVSGTAPAASSVQLPKPDVTINMVDYHFEMTGTLKSGSQTLLLSNSGTEMHEAQVVQLKPGTTFEQFQKLLMQSNGQEQQNIPATPVFGMVLSPGASAYTTADLTPGDYAIVCFIPSPKNGGKPHYMLGMISSATVK